MHLVFLQFLFYHKTCNFQTFFDFSLQKYDFWSCQPFKTSFFYNFLDENLNFLKLGIEIKFNREYNVYIKS